MGTPFYCYSASSLEAAYLGFQRSLAAFSPRIFYALKANSNQAVIATLARLGAGADVVSEGEMHRAIAAAIAPRNIVFAGVGKTASEMTSALEAGIYQFNVESLPELRRLSDAAGGLGLKAPVALRVNPDVDALTHKGISTGSAENKFGIDFQTARALCLARADYPGVEILGLGVHIGSQLMDLAPCRAAFERVAGLYRDLKGEGVGLSRLDLGGGLGICYRDESAPDIDAYARIVGETTAGLDAELAFEPGRRLVGQAGILITRVIYRKETAHKQFLVVDAAMNDLIRPMLYEAWHDIRPLREAAPDAAAESYDIVGPVCESTDSFTEGRRLSPLNDGDLLAICSTGAYGAVMSSTYNSRLLVPEIMVREGRYAVVRARPSYRDLIALDRLPDWLARPENSRGVA